MNYAICCWPLTGALQGIVVGREGGWEARLRPLPPAISTSVGGAVSRWDQNTWPPVSLSVCLCASLLQPFGQVPEYCSRGRSGGIVKPKYSCTPHLPPKKRTRTHLYQHNTHTGSASKYEWRCTTELTEKKYCINAGLRTKYPHLCPAVRTGSPGGWGGWQVIKRICACQTAHDTLPPLHTAPASALVASWVPPATHWPLTPCHAWDARKITNTNYCNSSCKGYVHSLSLWHTKASNLRALPRNFQLAGWYQCCNNCDCYGRIQGDIYKQIQNKDLQEVISPIVVNISKLCLLHLVMCSPQTCNVKYLFSLKWWLSKQKLNVGARF